MFDRDDKILLERYTSIYNQLLLESLKNRIQKYRIEKPWPKDNEYLHHAIEDADGYDAT